MFKLFGTFNRTATGSISCQSQSPMLNSLITVCCERIKVNGLLAYNENPVEYNSIRWKEIIHAVETMGNVDNGMKDTVHKCWHYGCEKIQLIEIQF